MDLGGDINGFLTIFSLKPNARTSKSLTYTYIGSKKGVWHLNTRVYCSWLIHWLTVQLTHWSSTGCPSLKRLLLDQLRGSWFHDKLVIVFTAFSLCYVLYCCADFLVKLCQSESFLTTLYAVAGNTGQTINIFSLCLKAFLQLKSGPSLLTWIFINAR